MLVAPTEAKPVGLFPYDANPAAWEGALGDAVAPGVPQRDVDLLLGNPVLPKEEAPNAGAEGRPRPEAAPKAGPDGAGVPNAGCARALGKVRVPNAGFARAEGTLGVPKAGCARAEGTLGVPKAGCA